jgi:nitrogen fixation protein FixH
MNESAQHARRWPRAMVAMVGVHIAFMVGVAVWSSRDPSFAVEPNHYQQALRWDVTAAQDRASVALGWQARVHGERALDAQGRRELRCELVDRAGAPVAGAQVAALAFAHARGQQRWELALHEGEPGHYRVRAPLARGGLWELRLEARRGSERFTTTVLYDLGGASP